jgi:hypothetical protein
MFSLQEEVRAEPDNMTTKNLYLNMLNCIGLEILTSASVNISVNITP